MGHLSLNTLDFTTNTWQQDFSTRCLVPPVPGNELVFWDVVPKAVDGTEPDKYEWVEEELTPITCACAEAIDTTETTITMSSAADVAKAGIRPGAMIVNITDSTTDEVMLVTAVSGADLTVVRDYGGFVSGSGGGVTGVTHSSGDVFQLMPTHQFEGSSIANTDPFPYRDRSTAYNYYSLIDEFTKVAGTDLVRQYRGNYPSNWAYQVDGVVQALNRKSEFLLLRSPRVQRTSTARGSMGGLIWQITQATGATSGTYPAYDTTSETFSYEIFDDACLGVHTTHGTLESGNWVLVMPAAGAQVIPYIHESAMRMDYARENVRGYFANSLMTTVGGKRIPVVVSASIPSDSFMLLNLDAVRVHYLVGRGLRVYNKPLGESLDDYVAQRWISELTLEFQRPTDNCVYHTGLTYTRPS